MEMQWMRDMMKAEGLSQKDIARAWGISESSVSRFLDGLTGDISARRIAQLSMVLGRPVEELHVWMGHEVWRNRPRRP